MAKCAPCRSTYSPNRSSIKIVFLCRNGARLILAYDTESNSFNGSVENTTDKVLERVRVEVHLSNGVELGPTTPGNLNPGEKREIVLTPLRTNFSGWTTHAEVGNKEHGSGEEGEHN